MGRRSEGAATRHTALVPPGDVQSGLASFILRGFRHGEWRSAAEARWQAVENEGDRRVEVGTVVVVTEGPKTFGFFTVEGVT